MNPAPRGWLIQSGIIAAPAAALIGIRMFMGGPSAAPATPASPESAPAAHEVSATPALTEKQRRAMAWLGSHAPRQPLSSPLDASAWNVVAPEPAVTPVQEPAPEPQNEVPDEIMNLRVTAVLGRSDGSWVALGTGVIKLGDEALAGWRVMDINVHLQTAVIRHSDGREFTVTRHAVLVNR